jgi:hypothetical protein
VLLGTAITVAWFAPEAQKPPNAKLADASPAEFSSGRAMTHVLEIARAPHPTGSREAERVREGVITKLANLGLTAEIQIPKDKRVLDRRLEYENEITYSPDAPAREADRGPRVTPLVPSLARRVSVSATG